MLDEVYRGRVSTVLKNKNKTGRGNALNTDGGLRGGGRFNQEHCRGV